MDPHYIIINNIKYICLAIVSLLSAGFVQCANLLDLFGNRGKPVTLYKKFVGTAKEVFLSKKTTNILPEARGLESTIEDFKKRSDDLDNDKIIFRIKTFDGKKQEIISLAEEEQIVGIVKTTKSSWKTLDNQHISNMIGCDNPPGHPIKTQFLTNPTITDMKSLKSCDKEILGFKESLSFVANHYKNIFYLHDAAVYCKMHKEVLIYKENKLITEQLESAQRYDSILHINSMSTKVGRKVIEINDVGSEIGEETKKNPFKRELKGAIQKETPEGHTLSSVEINKGELKLGFVKKNALNDIYSKADIDFFNLDDVLNM